MELTRTSNIDVRKSNFINTLRCILECEQISQPELAQKLALSWPTILQNVKDLVALGLVQEVGTFKSTGGRKARAFAPIRDAKVALGLDITQNHIGLVLVDLAGQPIQYKQERAAFSMDEKYGAFLSEAVQKFIKETRFSSDAILGIGISLPGIVDEEKFSFTSHILNQYNASLEFFRQIFPYSCRFINDANAAGFAEVRGTDNIEITVYLSLNNSVGGAILRSGPGGSIYMGQNLRAGEFGHTTLVPNGKPCYCGKQGCLDAYCSAKVLSRHTNNNLPAFFDGIQSGNTVLSAVWDTYLDDLAVAVNNLCMIFDCDIIIGGYVSRYLGEYIDQLKERLAARNTFGKEVSYLKTCYYQKESSAIGAALLLIDQFINSIE